MQLNVSTLERGTSGGDASRKKNTDRADGRGVGGQLAGREKSIVRVNDAKQWTLCR